MAIIILIVFGVTYSLLRQWRNRKSAKTMYSSGQPKIMYADAKGFVPSPEAWAMAAGAHHRIWYERPVDKLVDLEGRSSYKRFLDETWNVEKRDDLLSHLMNLFYRGPRAAGRSVRVRSGAVFELDHGGRDDGRDHAGRRARVLTARRSGLASAFHGLVAGWGFVHDGLRPGSGAKKLRSDGREQETAQRGAAGV
jgi:hypothetical protein